MNGEGAQSQPGFGFNTGYLHNAGAACRTQVVLEVRPVFGAVTVSLAHCLRLKGVIDPGLECRLVDYSGLVGAALRWAGDLTAPSFWHKLEPLGCSPEAVEASAREFGGARIGWAMRVYPQASTVSSFPADGRVCTDLCLTVAILSRRAGNLFLGYREPDYSWEQLFEWAFAADDPCLAARSISCEAWPHKDNKKPAPNPLNHPEPQG
jgi:hypothetical protein